MLQTTHPAGTVKTVRTDGESILNIWIEKDKSYWEDLKNIRKSRA